MNHSEIDSYRRWLNRQITKLASKPEEARETVREAGVRAACLGHRAFLNARPLSAVKRNVG